MISGSCLLTSSPEIYDLVYTGLGTRLFGEDVELVFIWYVLPDNFSIWSGYVECHDLLVNSPVLNSSGPLNESAKRLASILYRWEGGWIWAVKTKDTVVHRSSSDWNLWIYWPWVEANPIQRPRRIRNWTIKGGWLTVELGGKSKVANSPGLKSLDAKDFSSSGLIASKLGCFLLNEWSDYIFFTDKLKQGHLRSVHYLLF